MGTFARHAKKVSKLAKVAAWKVGPYVKGFIKKCLGFHSYLKNHVEDGFRIFNFYAVLLIFIICEMEAAIIIFADIGREKAVDT